MPKIFTLKGRSVEEVQKMSLEEFAKILPSRQRRTLLRGFTPAEKKLIENLRKAEKPCRTHCRNIVIIPEMIGKTLMVHNGKEWMRIDIRAEMLGHRLGEFAMTRKRVMHSAPGIGATKSSKFLPMK